MRQHIAQEADNRLGYYLPLSASEVQAREEMGVEAPERRGLGEGVVDTPLVRLFNFLREFLVLFCW